MANLDSRSKRASSVGMVLPFFAVPILPDGTLAQGDRQHGAFTYSGILAGAQVLLDFVLDLNTRLTVFLRDFYSSTSDLPTLSTRYLAEEVTGDYNVRWRQLVQDATDAMTS